MFKQIFKQFLSRGSIRDLSIFLLVLILFLPVLHLFFFSYFTGLEILQIAKSKYGDFPVLSLYLNNISINSLVLD
ncbi:hypothetical protein KN1_24120 [Stygiolobus caldivivus]|uniref:Uncharacterized protein n=1 Tax=Stygiolobus caldivivus TaxID=2824673 RepID=A0A8D5ZK80_9CREN|nr:hypothetical protein KN1_24120 [Stygiolobus caldivivus]